jgi:hypothetical protein
MADTRKTSATRTRRALLRSLTVGGALLASTSLVGCGSILHPPAPAGPDIPVISFPLPDEAPISRLPDASTPTGPPVGTVIMIIRHGEKPDEDTSPLPGINDQGQPDDSSLTKVGWDRANKLVDLFAPAQGNVKPGLARPKAIFAARPTDGGTGQRTRETVTPLAKKTGEQIDAGYGKGEEEQLVQDVLKQNGPVLVSWQHGEIPAITEAFGKVTPAPPSEWPDDRFDMVWTLTKTASGWNFAQVPEMVLPGDQVAPFAAGGGDEGEDED